MKAIMVLITTLIGQGFHCDATTDEMVAGEGNVSIPIAHVYCENKRINEWMYFTVLPSGRILKASIGSNS